MGPIRATKDPVVLSQNCSQSLYVKMLSRERGEDDSCAPLWLIFVDTLLYSSSYQFDSVNRSTDQFGCVNCSKCCFVLAADEFRLWACIRG